LHYHRGEYPINVVYLVTKTKHLSDYLDLLGKKNIITMPNVLYLHSPDLSV